MPENGHDTIREAVAVFDTADEFDAAIEDLMSAGFDRADISLLAGQHAVEEKLGHRYRRVADVEDDPNVPRTYYVEESDVAEAEAGVVGALMYIGAAATAGAVVASGGTLAGVIMAAALAGTAGGLIGSVLAGIIGSRHAEHLHEQLEAGGLLLWVHLRDAAHEARAVEILKRHTGHDIHVHDLPALGRAAWEESIKEAQAKR
jgi:hypothetical protein